MTRAPFQVLVFPFRFRREGPGRQVEYCILKRQDSWYWQGIAGGGETGENKYMAAARETREEIGISKVELVELHSLVTIPVVNISGFIWGAELLLIPEYSFGVEINAGEEIILSDEHTEFRWLSYEAARESLKWDSNKNAIWELNHRINHDLLIKNPNH